MNTNLKDQLAAEKHVKEMECADGYDHAMRRARRARREGFLAGVSYARSNPVETGEGDEEIIAKAIYSRQAGMHPQDWAAPVGHEQPEWSSIEQWQREEYRSQARAVLAIYGKPPALDPKARELWKAVTNWVNLNTLPLDHPLHVFDQYLKELSRG